MDVQKSMLGLDLFSGESASQTLIDSEIPLPEGRSAKQVLLSSAKIAAGETECRAGLVRVSGTLDITALCEDADGAPFGFTASSTFTHRIEFPGAAEDMRADAMCQVLELTLRPDGARLLIHAVAEIAVRVFTPLDTPIVTEITGTDVETREQLLPIGSRVLLGERTVRLREQIDAPDTQSVLLSFGGVTIREVAYAASQARVSGTVSVNAMIENNNGQLDAKHILIPFTEELDAAYSAQPLAEGTLLQLSLSAADASFSLLDAEAVVRIRLYGAEERTLSVLADAYDPRCSFTLEHTDVRFLRYLGGAAETVPVRENIRIPKHLPEAFQALFALITPVLADTNEQDGRLYADAMLLVNIVYRCDGGFLHSFSEDIPVRFPLSSAGDALPAVQLAVLSAAVAGSGRTLELQAELTSVVQRFDEETARLVSDVAAGGEAPPYRGILIYCADAGETVWDVGKRFAVPAAKLRAWNTDLAEPLRDGQAVVLVK